MNLNTVNCCSPLLALKLKLLYVLYIVCSQHSSYASNGIQRDSKTRLCIWGIKGAKDFKRIELSCRGASDGSGPKGFHVQSLSMMTMLEGMHKVSVHTLPHWAPYGPLKNNECHRTTPSPALLCNVVQHIHPLFHTSPHPAASHPFSH